MNSSTIRPSLRRNSSATLRAAALVAVFMACPSGAWARGLQLEAAMPVIVPLGVSSSVAFGITPTLQMDLTSRMGLTFTSGALWLTQGDEEDQLEVPFLLGVSYGAVSPRRGVQPYLSLKLGYTHAFGSEESAHWITASAGGGVLWRASEHLCLDLGLDILVPDLRGNSPSPAGLMFKIGSRFDLVS